MGETIKASLIDETRWFSPLGSETTDCSSCLIQITSGMIGMVQLGLKPTTSWSCSGHTMGMISFQKIHIWYYRCGWLMFQMTSKKAPVQWSYQSSLSVAVQTIHQSFPEILLILSIFTGNSNYKAGNFWYRTQRFLPSHPERSVSQ